MMGDFPDFEEKAAIATERLREQRAGGETALFGHVVVDEAQDLTPSRLSLLRALVDEGPNDLFICEDSRQRIYGRKSTLSQCGIRIVGRSRRLTLNPYDRAEPAVGGEHPVGRVVLGLRG